MKKKILMSLFLMIILLANVSFASYNSVTMNIVEDPVCTIDLGNNSKFEKKLVDTNLTNKEVTIQLQVTNNEKVEKLSGELMLLMDISNSTINSTPDGEQRKELIFNSAKTFVSKLLKDNDQLKIGIVSFSSNEDVSKEGTIEDASLVSSLTNDATSLNNAISNIEKKGPRTNLQSGLQLASKQFSNEETGKYIIVLTDGVPNIAIDYDKSYYSDDVIAKTKQELKEIEENNINIITMLTGIDDEEYIPGNSTKTFGEIIKAIFGSEEQPTAGKFYYITDDKIESTINNDIYNSLISTEKSYKNIKIVDYFPEEIIKNFDLAYVTNANIGTISFKVDTTNNSITWTIPELAYGETATVQYKLKLKENFNISIIDKILNTNKKVDISYTDFDNKDQTKTSDVSPKLKLTVPTYNIDDTSSPKELPKAGIVTIIGLGTLIVGFATFSIIRFININNKMKH